MIGDNGSACNGRVGLFAARTLPPTVLPTTSAWGDLPPSATVFDNTRHCTDSCIQALLQGGEVALLLLNAARSKRARRPLGLRRQVGLPSLFVFFGWEDCLFRLVLFSCPVICISRLEGANSNARPTTANSLPSSSRRTSSSPRPRLPLTLVAVVTACPLATKTPQPTPLLAPSRQAEERCSSNPTSPPTRRRTQVSPNTGRRALRMAPSATVVPPPPPLFFTKRVTTFLRANLSDLIRAAVLTTPAGNLLVHASSLPASILRRQCAVAASLWALHHPAPLPFSDANSSNSSSPVPSSSTASLKSSRSTIPAVTVQLDSGVVFVIRQLQCGILFICMGGEEPLLTPTQSVNGKSSASLASQECYLGEDDSPTASGLGSTASPGTLSSNITPLPSPSVQSLHRTATSSTMMAPAPAGLSQANVRALRRQVEELARWLDSRLGALHIPDAGIGLSVGA